MVSEGARGRSPARKSHAAGTAAEQPRRPAAEPTGSPRRRQTTGRGGTGRRAAVSTPRRRRPGSTTASSRTSSTKRREPLRTANRGPRWKCRHATIASCSGVRRSFPPLSPGSASRRATAGPSFSGQLGRCFHMGRRPDLAVGVRSRSHPDHGDARAERWREGSAWRVAFGSRGHAPRDRSGRRRQGGL